MELWLDDTFFCETACRTFIEPLSTCKYTQKLKWIQIQHSEQKFTWSIGAEPSSFCNISRVYISIWRPDNCDIIQYTHNVQKRARQTLSDCAILVIDMSDARVSWCIIRLFSLSARMSNLNQLSYAYYCSRQKHQVRVYWIIINDFNSLNESNIMLTFSVTIDCWNIPCCDKRFSTRLSSFD